VTETKRYLGLRLREWTALGIALPVVVGLIVAAKPLISHLMNTILHLDPTLVYVVVFALVFAEAAVFFGFIFPGETAVILGGVVASTGSVNVIALGALVVVGAIAGDSVGYVVGSRWGEDVLELSILKSRRRGVDAGLEMLRRRGALAIFIGRFTAFLRAVIPGLAGLSRMHYRTFLKANAAGGIVWGVTFTAMGYAVGGAYQRAEKYASSASTALLILVVMVAVTLFVRGRIKEHRIEEEFRRPVKVPPETLAEEIEAARQRFEQEEG
jgi:membrane protein DedA with SNARE-associated domain